MSFSLLPLAAKAGSRKGVDIEDPDMSSAILGLRKAEDPSDVELANAKEAKPSPLRLDARAGDTP